LKQCGESTDFENDENEDEEVNSSSLPSRPSLIHRERDPFYDTDRCDRDSTIVIHLI
jgi:hypothetical protein